MILERYIIREILAPFAAIGLVLIAIFSGYSSTRFLNDAVNGLLSGQTVAALVFLKVLIALEILLPATLCLAVVLGLGRLYADGEIMAMEAGGIQPGRITRSIFILALPLALLVSALSLYGRPWAYGRIYALEVGAGEKMDFGKMEAGRFYQLDDSRVFFAETLDPDTKQAGKVRLWKQEPDGREVIFAEKARQEGGAQGGPGSIVFNRGYQHLLSTTGGRDRLIRFEQGILRLSGRPAPPEFRRKAAPGSLLANSSETDEMAEYQWRWTTGPATVLLALLAIPLSRTAPRRNRYGKATATIILFFLYYNSSLIAKTWVEKGVIPPIPGIWTVVLILALLVFLLLFIPWVRQRRCTRRVEFVVRVRS